MAVGPAEAREHLLSSVRAQLKHCRYETSHPEGVAVKYLQLETLRAATGEHKRGLPSDPPSGLSLLFSTSLIGQYLFLCAPLPVRYKANVTGSLCVNWIFFFF